MSRKATEYEVSVQAAYRTSQFLVRAHSHRQAYIRFMKQHAKKLRNFHFVNVINVVTRTSRTFVAKTGAIVFARDSQGVLYQGDV